MPDLELQDWNAINGEFVGEAPQGALLVGDGLSRAVWDGFRMRSSRTFVKPDSDLAKTVNTTYVMIKETERPK